MADLYNASGAKIVQGTSNQYSINVSAGTASNNLLSLVFSNSNGVSFGLDGATITASAVGGAGGGIAAAAGSQTATSGTALFSNSNGITFGMSNSSVITASHNGLTSQSNQAFSAGGGSSAFQTLSFSNANGVSFTNSAGQVAVTHDLQYTSATSAITSNALNTSASRVINVVAATNNTGGGTASLSSNVSFSNANGATFYTSAGGAVALSYSVPTVTNSSWSVSDSATSGSVGRLAFTNLNGVTLSLSTGAAGSHTIVGSHNGLTSQSNQAFSASGGSSAFQTLVFTNSNGITWTNTAGSVAVTHDLQYTSNTSAITSNALNTSVSRVINIVAATNNTGGGTASLSSNVSFTNANGATFYTSAGGAVALSYTVPAGGTPAFSADASSTFNTLTFQNSNGVSFSNNAGALRVTHDLQYTSNTSAITSNALNTSVSRVINIIAATNNTGGGTASLSSNVSFSNANGATFYTSAGGAVALSYSVPTVPTAYVSSVNGSSGAISFATGSSLSSSQNGSTITWGLASNITTALQSAGAYLTTAALSGDTSKYVQNWKLTGNTAGTTSSAQGTDLWLSGGNNVTVSGNSNSIVFSVGNYITTARASTDAIGLNTAQSNVTWTVNSGGLTLDGRGYAGTATSGNNISLTVNSGGITASVAAPGGGAAINVSAGTTSNNLQTIVFSNSNGVSFGLNGSTVTASAAGGAAESNWINLLGANTASNTSASGSTIGWSGSNITLAGTNGSQVIISAPAISSLVGINGISISTAGSTLTVMNNYISSYENQPLVTAATMTLNMASISHCVAFNLPEPISASFLRIPVSMSMNSTSIATSANSNTGGVALYSTFNAVIYSLGVGGNSQSLQSVASGSAGFTFSNSISIATNGTQCSISQGYSAQAEGIAATVTTQYSVSTSLYPFSSTAFSRFSAGRFLDIPFANSLLPGPYWLVFGGSSSTNATTGSAALSVMTNCLARYSNHYGVSQGNVAFGVMNNANLTSGGFLGAGSFSTAGGGTTASLPLSAISSSASNVRPYFQMLRSA